MTQQPRLITVTIQRPPFYRPPRCRPVTFERPSGDETTSGRNRATPVVKQVKEDRQQQFTSPNMGIQVNMMAQSRRQLAHLPDYNRSPKPFNRPQGRDPSPQQQHYLYEQQQQQQQHINTTPRIVIQHPDDCGQISGADFATSRLVENKYPTSTVHKSMLNSRKNHLVQQAGSTTQIENATQPELQLCSLSEGNNRGQAASFIQQQQQTDSVALPREGGDYYYLKESNKPDSYQSNQTLPSTRWSTSSTTTATAIKPGTGGVEQSYGNSLRRRPRAPASSVCLPDSKRDESIRNKKLEQTIIARQNYRTLPIVLPKPKARHDLATGNYMRLEQQDPTFLLAMSSSGGASRRKPTTNTEIEMIAPSGEWNRSTVGREASIIGSSGDQTSTFCVNTAKIGTRQKPSSTARMQSCAHQQSQDYPGWQIVSNINNASHPERLEQSSLPAFNYREYIELTRRAT